METVKDVENFFGKEFSARELARAIEDLNFYTDEIKSLYKLENDANAEKTFVLGTLAGNAIAEKIEDERGERISDDQMDEIYKLGIDVAQDKYPSFEILEARLGKFFANEKEFHPYSKDIRNLEKVLDTWEESIIETKGGAFAKGSLNSVWIDNWRMTSGVSASQASLSYGRKSPADWLISYKGTPIIAGDYGGHAECIASGETLAKTELNIGDTLQTVGKKLGLACPQIDVGEHRPSQNYHIDEMEFKERDFLENPPYPGFAEQMRKAMDMAERNFDATQGLDGYSMEKVLPRSRNPEDRNLFCVMAKGADGKYAVWTSFNLSHGKNGSLENGHYDIKNLNAAAKIMCSFSDATPLRAEHDRHAIQNVGMER